MNHKNQKTFLSSSYIHILICVRIYQQVQMLNLLKQIVIKFSIEHSAIFLLMDQHTCKKIKQIYPEAMYQLFNRSQHIDRIDFVVTIGGDGTILYAAKQFQKVTPPFLTFQKGTLGFLCKFKPQESDKIIQNALLCKKIIKKSDNLQNLPFNACRLMRLKVLIKNTINNQNIIQQKKVVLNEVAITRKDSTRIAIQIYVDGQYITTTTGDGILISTPTGSTAYALSSGGPIVLNGVNTIILVPLAPNSLSFRPICLPSTSVINIKLSDKSKSNAFISFDGQSNMQLTQMNQIQIRHQTGTQNNDLILYQSKIVQWQYNNMPTWMQRLKYYLGWNQVFKSPACQVMSKSVSKIQ